METRYITINTQDTTYHGKILFTELFKIETLFSWIKLKPTPLNQYLKNKNKLLIKNKNKMRKYLYFRTVADEANDGVTGLKTNNPSSFLFPADNLTAIQPTDDGVLTLYFKPALAQGDNMLRDSVNLNVNEGDHYEVMSAITDAIANPARGHSDGFIVIADDVTTTDSATSALNDLAVNAQYVHSSITSCGDITVQPTSVYGICLLYTSPSPRDRG